MNCPSTAIFPDLVGFSNDSWASLSDVWEVALSHIDFNSYEPFAVAAGTIKWPGSSMLSSNDWNIDHCEGLGCEDTLAYYPDRQGIVRLYDLDDYSAMKTYLLTSSDEIEVKGIKLLQESKSHSVV